MEGTGNASWFLAGRAQEEPPGARGMQDSTMGLPDRGTVKGGRGFVSDRFCGACRDRNEMPGPLQASWGGRFAGSLSGQCVLAVLFSQH